MSALFRHAVGPDLLAYGKVARLRRWPDPAQNWLGALPRNRQPISSSAESAETPTRIFNVLDLVGGSGSTLIAAHKTGRRAYLSELDPTYCDRIIRRWEIYASDEAERIACGIEPNASLVGAAA